ncbi:MAG: peptidoglycan DD-metalloendopeptidase family protein [Bacteroidota bacterium]
MENQEQTFWERLRYTYRLIIMNNETFEEVGSYRLSLLSLYSFLSVIVVLVAVGMCLLIFFTPIREYIPGYAGSSEQQELVEELEDKIEELEEQTKTREDYINNIKRVLAGNVEHVEDVEEQLEENTENQDYTRVLPGEEELEVRKEIRAEVMRPTDWIKTNESPSTSVEESALTLPVSGEVIGAFDGKKQHFGVDIAAPTNTAIKAILDGRVIFAEFTMETGNVVAIQHDNNLVSFYKHNSSLLTSVGTQVKAGEAIAVIGNTGTKTTGPHLHFELWHEGKPIDATEYMTFY